METVYVGFGGNIGDAAATITKAALAIQALHFVEDFEISNYYLTSPVSSIPQDNYVNAVCRFKTSLEPTALFAELELISATLGKIQKVKEAPRIIDLDLLFFGERLFNDGDLQVPHSQWSNRLFVLVPLLDLIEEIVVPTPEGLIKVNLTEYVQNFTNIHHEKIVVLNENYRGITTNAKSATSRSG
ncbi:MAG: 2-amino-4-hydroxy-6-hydroxymethyldihydropteridine diphosphokinase [Parachlamydiaceae bacterium]|nr:2-amino-4-hydroxy-6-hydroxymethyldihydropteridine diphosphokinase [Parachlamydiaceae bacterium]